MLSKDDENDHVLNDDEVRSAGDTLIIEEYFDADLTQEDLVGRPFKHQ